MARPTSAAAPAPQAVAATRSSKKLLTIISAVVLLVMLLGGGAAVALKKLNHAEDDDVDAKKPVQKAAKRDEAPVFVRFEPFTAKLQPDPEKDQEQYLQVVPEMRVIDAPAGEKVKLYTPEIRHTMLLVLLGKKSADLSTTQGVEKLSNEIRNRANLIVDGEQTTPLPSDGRPRPDDSVQAVMFTSFIIQ